MLYSPPSVHRAVGQTHHMKRKARTTDSSAAGAAKKAALSAAAAAGRRVWLARPDVVRVVQHSGPAEPMVTTGPRVFSSLLSPVSEQAFFESCWEQVGSLELHH